MVRFESVSFRYHGGAEPVLRDVTLDIAEGELCLVVGQTGSGKSTLLGAINGLVPHFTGGTLEGRVVVAGRDTRTHPPRELADVVGVVGQDPRAGFVTDIVEDELAYAMESLGTPPDVMRTRVEETLDLLGLAEFRSRPISTLSGGQQQRVAIGSVLTSHPHVLVLDEPTSALDPAAAEEVLAAIHRLVHDLGMTVVLAEHRLERVVQYADRVVYLPGAGRPVVAGDPAEVMAQTDVAPPVVQLARVAGWEPVPLSVRDARSAAAPLRLRLEGTPPQLRPGDSGSRDASTERPLVSVRDLVVTYRGSSSRQAPPPIRGRSTTPESGTAAGRPALLDVRLDLAPGEVLALMGRNGSGKSSLLKALVGLVRPARGTIRVATVDPTTAKPATIVAAAGLVPQEPADLLYAETVEQECKQADRDFRADPGTCADIFARLVPTPTTELASRHPRDLSEGERLCLALAVILTAAPPLVLLDEPTRGLDYISKQRLVEIVRDLRARRHGVILATHDVELVAEVATRAAVLADGEVVADGPVEHVLAASPTFAPQVAKVLRPLPYLTVSQVAAALGGTP
ncbi:MAG TPA: ATP-binding cassette domain-containing protein [Actinopolymorphaceae bacterium]|jgi:energy-coupling factor transport system ATP-binding protein